MKGLSHRVHISGIPRHPSLRARPTQAVTNPVTGVLGDSIDEPVTRRGIISVYPALL
jgi:hypothetical protein